MPYAEVERPIPGPGAFAASDDAGVLSQAAILLRIREELLAARAGAEPLPPLAGAPRDEDELPVPPPARTDARYSAAAIRDALQRRHDAPHGPRLWSALEGDDEAVRQVVPDVADAYYVEPTTATAAALSLVAMQHPDEIVRVAAAATHFELSVEPRAPLAVLVEGTSSEEPLVREVAATVLGRIAPGHPRLAELAPGWPTHGAPEPAHTSVLVHGTWARNDTWWQPGGSFHTYLRGQVLPDLYNGADRFAWSGGYSDAARALGAADLRAWVSAHGLSRLDTLVTHSHGGSVAMLATQGGLDVGELVLLSCPVHVPKYVPDFAQVTKAVSVRVHMDLVILADRGGQRFSLPQIRENVLPLWFDHSATHDAAVWTKHNVPAML